MTAVAGKFEPMVRQRVRIRFSKQGDLRLIGHRDLVRTMERMFRRAALRLRMSQGFHPKPLMSFPTALAVGIEGLDEIMELELAELCTAEQLHARLAPCSVPGLTFQSIEVLPEGAKKPQVRNLVYRVPVPAERRREVADRVTRLMQSRSHPVQRPGRTASIDLRGALEELTLTGGILSMRLRVSRQADPGPRDVLAALELTDLEQEGACLTRTAVELQS